MQRAQKRSRGFTLIELLVVMVIVGIIVSIATLSFGVLGRDSQSEDQTRRVWATLQQAREEAELQGLDFGVFLSSRAYQFLGYQQRDQRWVPMENDKFYATRELPEGLRFRVWIDSREIVLKPQLEERKPLEDRKKKDDDEDDAAKEAEAAMANVPMRARLNVRKLGDALKKEEEAPPQLMILSSGDIMPFELQVERDNQPAEWRVVAQPDNDLRLERRDGEKSWLMIQQTHPPFTEENSRTARASK